MAVTIKIHIILPETKNKMYLTSSSVPFLNLTFSYEEELDLGSGDEVIT